MNAKRKPSGDPITYRKNGRLVATDTLVSEVEGIQVDESVEFDYLAPSGVEVSKVGTVRRVEETDVSTDAWVDTGAENDAYIHVNRETRDVFFVPDTRVRGDTRLLLFDRRG